MNLLVARLAAWTQGRYNYGNCRKSSKIFESVRKNSESTQNDLPTIFENFRKSSEVFDTLKRDLGTDNKLELEVCMTNQEDWRARRAARLRPP